MNPKGQQQSVKLFHHISDEYQQAFYHMPNIGRKTPDLFDTILDSILARAGAFRYLTIAAL